MISLPSMALRLSSLRTRHLISRIETVFPAVLVPVVNVDNNQDEEPRKSGSGICSRPSKSSPRLCAAEARERRECEAKGSDGAELILQMTIVLNRAMQGTGVVFAKTNLRELHVEILRALRFRRGRIPAVPELDSSETGS
jgi:hypothetical protein